ncbi:MAG: hypothetical protein ACI8UO_002419 [Verrucomicrobiales bacterium]|jgi:hypothetical protein
MKALILTLFAGFILCTSIRAESPFHGSWAFEMPDGNPAWLQVSDGDDGLAVSVLWSVGNPKPAREVRIDGGILRFKWNRKWRPFGIADDVRVLAGEFTGKIAKSGALELSVEHFAEGKPEAKETMTLSGKKMPPMPKRPDLAKLKFGKPVELFNGTSLAGWKLTNPKKKNGWRAEDGILVNETPKTDFSAYGEYGNLVTEQTFEDFRLTIEYNVDAKSNSGIYLRGMYEAQVVDRDSPMQGKSGPGAIFGRILPTENAGKSGGEWNRYVLTLADRHVTVELNGKTVIDNQPLEGCTGGGISADDTAPGPIFLQGDHTSVRYRNIVIEPILK